MLLLIGLGALSVVAISFLLGLCCCRLFMLGGFAASFFKVRCMRS